jgi:mannose-1-phosphate guanylyltransferase
LNTIPDAIILCGGAGTRLRSVTGDSPKSMASVGGRPFLELLIQQLQRNGFERVILAVGYQKDVIRSTFGEQAFGLEVVYSEESSPLGTAGALRNAADLVKTDTTLAMNGDSYAQVDLRQFVTGHREQHSDISMVVVPTDERGDCGSVRVDGQGMVSQFVEKQPQVLVQYVNAGIYLMSRPMLYDIPTGREVSLEREVFPRWLNEGRFINAFVGASPCVDIGTPERYHRAQNQMADVHVEPHPEQSTNQK